MRRAEAAAGGDPGSGVDPEGAGVAGLSAEVPRELADADVAGRERTYLEHFWNDFAADPKHSVSEAAAGAAERRHFAKTLAEPVVLHIIGYGPTDTNYTGTSVSGAR